MNTRTKDWVDLVLLIERGALTPDDLQASLAATFARRNTHPLPPALPPPPDSWATDFPGMAAEAGLSVTDHMSAFAVLAAYWTTHAMDSQ